MSEALEGLKPEKLWEIFAEMSRIPRGSGKEQAIAEYLKVIAEEAELVVKKDGAGNMIVCVPASPGCEKATVTVLQGHMDMVWSKNENKEFDFDKDPIILVRDGDWIRADGTTLGADNGIGLAAGMAVALDPDLIHGPLEILLTVDEETGMTGAKALAETFLTGRLLLNLDSEEADTITIGCAGGAGVDSRLDLSFQETPEDFIGVGITVTGLRGGHSGSEIHEHRANAIKLLARTLWALVPTGVRIAEFHGGEAHNVIPREAFARIALPQDELEEAEACVSEMLERFSSQFSRETGLSILFESSPRPERALSADATGTVVDMLLAFPNGVLAMHGKLPDLVETSNNLSSARLDEEALHTHNSPRSSSAGALRGVLDQIQAVGRLAGATNAERDSYPAWEPNTNSKILKLVEEVHEEIFGRPPARKAIHAGLECGIIGKKFPGMDMVSFGPVIKEAHSPNESVNIPSVESFWSLLTAVLARIAGQGLEPEVRMRNA